jgi:sigma-B regulation protein RsbQ
LPKVEIPTLILQCSEDIIASKEVGEFVHRCIPNSEIRFLEATGHCPNLSAPDEVIAAMRTFV